MGFGFQWNGFYSQVLVSLHGFQPWVVRFSAYHMHTISPCFPVFCVSGSSRHVFASLDNDPMLHLQVDARN